ncbi:class I SAM-dependent methyltransferase [Ferroacidibacillus organovorans]|uniref:Methyltransferase domain-containing protein n=1 Tax=Ferroacidibacillus organovorans TaxID=1765683 RepID=A0A117SYG2_9BACL|nr:class I SAM-dependent methyltransferase [Ferroacidibacillus organovorans]KUO96905.1 hypothetical protein ATW55_08910 [Ferroacidibacillus organovorans]
MTEVIFQELEKRGINLDATSRILEIGCGTGRTACEIARRFGCQVTGVDLRKSMIERALERALREGVSVHFFQVKPGPLPFFAQSFDFVLAESVAVFNPIFPLLREWKRVLAPHGSLIDLEMAASFALPDDALHAFKKLYGAVQVPTVMGWKKTYEKAGFSSVEVMRSGAIRGLHTPLAMPDPSTHTEAAYTREIIAIIQENQRVMMTYDQWLSYAMILARG